MQESEGVLCMRVSFRIALAGQVIGVSALYEQTRTFCKNYLTDAPASFEVAVTPADIAFEREKSDREAAVEGHAPGNFSDEYLETLALYRKIVERLLEWLLHQRGQQSLPVHRQKRHRQKHPHPALEKVVR